MDIYKTFDKATANTSAYCLVTESGDNFGRVIFKHGNSGNVRCFLQIWGYEMQLGQAGGYGYDKHSASFQVAAMKLKRRLHDELASVKLTVAREYNLNLDSVELVERMERERINQTIQQFLTPDAIDKCEGIGWRRACEDCGLHVFNVI